MEHDPKTGLIDHAPRFSKDTLSFLGRLKRNNRREWFNARKDEYEAVDIFTKLMGDKVEPRREFIQEHARSVRNLDL